MGLLRSVGCYTLLAFFVLGARIPAKAQAMPTATSRIGLQVGAGATAAKPDFDNKYIAGITGYGDFEYKEHLGIEAEYHYLNLYSPLDIAENSLLGGLRYKLNFGRLHPYVKAMGGRGTFELIQGYNATTSSQTYTVVAAGGGLDVGLFRHLGMRVDFEYQDWLKFRTGGLTPSLGTIGFSYRFR